MIIIQRSLLERVMWIDLFYLSVSVLIYFVVRFYSISDYVLNVILDKFRVILFMISIIVSTISPFWILVTNFKPKLRASNSVVDRFICDRFFIEHISPCSYCIVCWVFVSVCCSRCHLFFSSFGVSQAFSAFVTTFFCEFQCYCFF